MSRGDVVDEVPLYAALANRTIGFTALDVWYGSPAGDRPPRFPFHELTNVIMTPHIAGATENSFAYRWAAIDANPRCLRADEPLSNVVPRTRVRIRSDGKGAHIDGAAYGNPQCPCGIAYHGE